MPPLLKHYRSSDSESESVANKKPTVANMESDSTFITTKSRHSSETISEPQHKETSNVKKQPDLKKEVSDNIHIPDAWSFAVVISPRNVGQEITEEMATGRSDGMPRNIPAAPRTEIINPTFNQDISTIQSVASPSDLTMSGGVSRATSVAPKTRVATDKNSLTALSEQDPLKFQLICYRYIIQKRRRAIEKSGLASLKTEDFDLLTKALGELAFYTWPDDPTDYLESTRIDKAVKVLKNTTHYGDEVAELATKLSDRWAAKDFRPGPINIEGNDLINDDESESEDENLQTGPSYGQGLVRHIMRGVIRYRNTRGNLTMKLDPRYRRRDFDIFGHNGLTIGEWWPFQICALRDGAHGSRQGGIAGRTAEGTFSIVVSGQSEYNDRDSGYELYYSGTHGDAPSITDTAAQLTNATKTLIMAMSRRKPVRVIRKGPSENNRLYPSIGYRYDGLYTVVGREIVKGRNGQRDFYRFKLVRNAGQADLATVRNRPTPDEYAAYQALTSA
ncbi:PUA-like domain-containing protein [Trichophaea hybrida]|nr:PUA-like domain-containing protein [Trichophaea hybrida]